MWSSKEKIHRRKTAAVSGRYCLQEEKGQECRKFSSVMAMLLGLIVTFEIMIAGAMILNFDFHTADLLAVFFAFAVLYFGVVAVLTDK